MPPSPEPIPRSDEILDRFRSEGGVGGGDAHLVGDGSTTGGRRGRLKIFFGMSPGVGKTYAMLAAARRLAGQGVDVAVGVVETHGRAETEQMLLGLDLLPLVEVAYEGSRFQVFDADGAIRRKPDILLIDELAHSNVPGSPGGRAKRWQDVEFCLRAGIDVYTTLNVQHLESINDVVRQITGVKVRETIPDRVFEEADEIELVDLPVESLHERLRAGKVYLGESASRAVDPEDGFFRGGNLAALRELALRRTAAWVDRQMHRYKQDRGIRAVWPAGERILVAVSPSPMSGKLVRAARRMAAGLHADLIAVYVETPRTVHLSTQDRERLEENMRLASALGATTETIAGSNAARELIGFARARNVGKIVVGKTARSRWRDVLLGSFVDTLIRLSEDIDIYVVRGDDDASVASASRPVHVREMRRWNGYAASLAMVGLVTLLGIFVFHGFELANVAMIFLAVVVLAALWFGRGPAVSAAVAAVAAFDFCFVAPRWTFAVSDIQYLLTFAVMLGVGLLVATLASRAREMARRAWARERTTAAQFAVARDLAAARDAGEVARIAVRHAHDLMHSDAVLCRRASSGESALEVLAASGTPDWFEGSGSEPERERGVARWAIDHGRAAGAGTQRLPSSAGHYIPLIATAGTVGLLGVRIRRGASPDIDPASHDIAAIQAIATQAASALERVMLAESQQASQIAAEREKLRNALLSSVSHDLRTPLAGIAGAASTLEQAGVLDASTKTQLLRTIVEESSRLNDIIANLVFATRLESGAVDPRREWTTVEEVVGVGLARHRQALTGRSFRVDIADNVPMIKVDNAMFPQVIHNLIENALKYTPRDSSVGITSWASEGSVVVKVWDEGPGLSEDESTKVFERFYRGRSDAQGRSRTGTVASPAGMGLGLTICEGIVRAHGGRIWAEPNSPRGASFLFSLPIEYPQPMMPTREEAVSESERAS